MPSLPASTYSYGSVSRLNCYLVSGLFAALTAGGAFIRIPVPYVPITLQTFFVILSGIFLGPKFGALSQLIYLAVGLMGVPVFSNGGGPGYVLQPTFGYLLGFPIAAYLIGVLLRTKMKNHGTPSFFEICTASAVGVLVILFLGAAVLYLNLRFIIHKPISMLSVLLSYFVVFIPGDIIKIVLSAVTFKRLCGVTRQLS